jgi:hypothetical protein
LTQSCSISFISFCTINFPHLLLHSSSVLHVQWYVKIDAQCYFPRITYTVSYDKMSAIHTILNFTYRHHIIINTTQWNKRLLAHSWPTTWCYPKFPKFKFCARMVMSISKYH